MGKATIIEAQNSNTTYEQGSKGILGKLKGVFADYKNGTRNADRLYTEELWDNRVFGSEDVMEALETKTLFGELDHPEGDRCETLAKNAAISIVKLEKRPEEGVIYGEAEILDTPTGRIVKALADSGAQLGISSRGMGEEIFENGKNIIDPNTYDFITFDVVVTPANAKARVALAESKQISSLKESLQKEINNCETENQLQQAKKVLENIPVTDKDNLVKEVENKISIIQATKTENKLLENNKTIASDLINAKYKELKIELEESNKLNSSLVEENKKLIEQLDFFKESKELLKTKLKEAKNETKEIEYLLKESVETNEFFGHTLESDYEEYKGPVAYDKFFERASDNGVIYDIAFEELGSRDESVANRVCRKIYKDYRQAMNKYMKEVELLEDKENCLNNLKEINNKKIEKLQKDHEEEITKLNESLKASEQKFTRLVEANKLLSKNIEASSKITEENLNLKKQIESLKQEKIESAKKLTESKLMESNKIKQLEDEIKALKENKAQLEEAEDRFSKLAFNPIGNVKALKENIQSSNDLSDDDLQLFNALINK